jgi:hypothetical protein
MLEDRQRVMSDALAVAEEKANAQPEPVTVTKEVVPDDYFILKTDRDLYKAETERLYSEACSYKEQASEAANELKRAKDRIRNLEEQKAQAEDLRLKQMDEADKFISGAYAFIKKSSAYVWAVDHMGDLPEDKRRDFRNAILALNGFCRQMMDKVGGNKDGEES